MAADDAFMDKAVEGLVLYAFNKGEVCTCPSRALIHESIYDEFIERCLKRIAAIKQGDPLDRETMIGAQVSTSQREKIESYVKIGRDEGAEMLIGGKRPGLNGRLAGAVRARRRRLDSRHQPRVPYGPRDPGRARVEHCYHQYPAHAAFGGYKASGVGRENHRMMLDHYTQTKCLLVSYDPNPLGFF
jgi:aldehyde dehydrogenase